MGIINEGLNWRKRPWEEVRKGGKQNYIIKNGVLGWGMSSAVLCSLALIFLSSPRLAHDLGSFYHRDEVI